MPTTLAQKYQIKPGLRLVVLNPPDGYLEKLTAELEGIAVSSKAAGKSDAVLLFVNNLAESQRLAPKAVRAVEEDGLLWIAYPEGSSKVKTDVNRDSLWKAVEPTGLRPVRQIALDDTWSAMRFDRRRKWDDHGS